MYVTINYNMYTICIRNTARSKSIPLLCTHVYSYMFSTVHPPRFFNMMNVMFFIITLHILDSNQNITFMISKRLLLLLYELVPYVPIQN